MTLPTALEVLTKDELKDLFAHFDLEKPRSIWPYSVFLSELEHDLRELFPEANLNKNGSFILTEKMVKKY